MAETLTENQICPACGVGVRPNSLFCYNCGGDVAENPHPVNGHAAVSPLNAETSAKTTKLESLPIENAPPPPTIEKTAEIKAEVIEEPKLKSAATMRRQPKSIQQKQIEVIWEEPQGDSLLRLFLVTLLLLAFVGAIIYFAVYNK